MIRDDTRVVHRLLLLRWVIPVAVAFVGASYMVFEDVLLEGHSISAPYVLSAALFFGLAGPAFAWLTLTWAARAAEAEARAQEETHRRARQLEAASEASQKVTAILDVDELLSEVTNLVRDFFGYYSVSLFWTDANSHEIVLRAGSGQAKQPLRTRGLRLKIGEQGITGRVAATGQPVLCNNVNQEPNYYSHELLPGTRSELAVPLRYGDQVVGVLDVQSDQLNAFRGDDLTVLQILADQVAIALENARLFQETRHQFEVMRALHDISLDITSKLDHPQVLAAILEQAAQLLDAHASSLSVYEPSTGMVRKIAVHNLPSEFAGVAVPLSEGVIGNVVKTGQPLIVNDYRHWEGRSAHFESPLHDTIVGAPLRWHGDVVGVLCVIDRAERRCFTEEDVHLLTLFADLASIALKNSELYAQVVDLSRDLESNVKERTKELAGTREELALKAAQLQRLLAATVRIEEEERGRIARDLHDGSNQLIAGTLCELQAAQESMLDQRTDASLQKLDVAKALLRRIEAENRRIILGLRPPILDAHGLVPAVKWLADSFREQYRRACTVRVSGQQVRLAPELETAIYRIVQESLNNILAHARAEHVQIRADFLPTEFCLEVEDDGVGFDHAKIRAAEEGDMGLIGMRERAESIEGWLQVESAPGRGTRIILHVPLSGKMAKAEVFEPPEPARTGR